MARSAEDLFDKLQQGLVWRRKEISSAFVSAGQSDSIDRDALYRAFWLLLYAHWEGFVKSAFEDYFKFVASRKLKYGELQPNFLALKSSPLIRATDLLSRNENQTLAFEMLVGLESARFSERRIPVDTKSNLSYKVLRMLEITSGVDSTSFVEEDRLDKMLLGRRNGIAHGEWLRVDRVDAEQMRTDTLEWMSQILNNISNAAVMKEYLRP